MEPDDELPMAAFFETDVAAIATRKEIGNAPFFAHSTAAAHETGVLYQGEFETPGDGTARAVRAHATALAATGIPVLLRSFSGVVVSADGVAEPVFLAGMPPEVDREVGHLLKTSIASMRPLIKHVVIRSPEHCRQLLLPRGAIPLESHDIEQYLKLRNAIYSNTIVYSVWERDRIDPGIAEQLAMVKQCWVPCAHNRDMLIRSGVPADKVHVVPHPYLPNDPLLRLTRRPTTLHGGARRYYSIGRWEPRKGFDQLILAFLLAHHPDDNASLTIKWSGSGQWPGYVAADRVLASAAADLAVRSSGWTAQSIASRVKLIGGRVNESMILKLHLDHNIYVSASHGEAWGLPAFDAKLAGNRLVYVPSGGVEDFAADSDCAVDVRDEPVHPSYRWEADAQWSGYSVRDLAQAMKSTALPEGFERPAFFEERFSLAAVGKKMRDLVDAALAG